MLCSKCQFENPELNRFCGMCGAPLQQPAATDPAPANEAHPAAPNVNGTSTRRPFIVSSTAMADATAHMLNTRVVLPTPTIGTATHSGYATPIKPEKISHGEDVIEHGPAPVDPNDEPVFADLEEAPVSAAPFDESDRAFPDFAEEERQERLERNAAEHEEHMPRSLSESRFTHDAGDTNLEIPGTSFLQFDPPEESTPSSASVSGPSFLGLGNPSNDYLLEDEQPVSHVRRNLMIFSLLIFGVLGFLEWRASSRGESTNPMDVLHVHLPKKKGQGEVQVLPPAGTAPASSPSDNSSASGDAKPDLVAEPNQSATKSSEQSESTPTNGSAAPASTPAQPAGNPATPGANPAAQSPASASGQDHAGAEAASPTSSAAPAKPVPSRPARNEVADNTPPPTAKPKVPQAEPVATKPAASKPISVASAPPAEADGSLNFGAFELQKGKAAGPTDLGRMWLWKAVAKGNGEAPVLLADMYLTGNGVSKDCEQAMLLLDAAAKKANPAARSKLGSMYATGECVSKDRVEAYRWMSSALAANPGSEWLEKNRQSLLSQMTPAERQRAAAIH